MGRNRKINERKPATARRTSTAQVVGRNAYRKWAGLAAVTVVFAVIAAGLVFFRTVGPPAGAANLPAGSAAPATHCQNADVRYAAINRAMALKEIAKAPAYTQGLIFFDGKLYESTGLRGRSAIYRLDLGGGRHELVRLEDKLFGEGLARIGDRLYQLTWRAGLAFAYAHDHGARTLARVSTFHRDGEGWGLTNLDDELVLSDGSDILSFVDPATFEDVRALSVRLGNQPIRNLNELEIVHGEILANIYGDTRIVGIDPQSGCVTLVIDATGLVEDVAGDLRSVADPFCSADCSRWDFVLNGIAYDSGQDELYLTGKNWPRIFVFNSGFGQ